MKKQQFIEFIDKYPQFFKKDKDWFIKNWHVVKAFENVAVKLINLGRKHYSARTIVEVLVHQSNVREIDGDFKIGNDNAPDLARAFVAMYPQHVNFWEYRRKDHHEFKKVFESKDEKND
jgi:hypothetical protein